MKKILAIFILLLMVNSMVAQSFYERLHLSVGYEFDRTKFKTSLKDEFGSTEFIAKVRLRFHQQFLRCRLDINLNERNSILVGYDRSLVYLNGDQFSNTNTTHHFHFGHILTDSFINVKKLSYFTSNNLVISRIHAEEIAYFLLPHDVIYKPDIRFRGLGINTELGIKYHITPFLAGSLFIGARIIPTFHNEDTLETDIRSVTFKSFYGGLQLQYALSKYTFPSTTTNFAP